ncbi:hypothetical protein GCM10027610_049990 [Dactylosporangium cerinum]
MALHGERVEVAERDAVQLPRPFELLIDQIQADVNLHLTLPELLSVRTPSTDCTYASTGTTIRKNPAIREA